MHFLAGGAAVFQFCTCKLFLRRVGGRRGDTLPLLHFTELPAQAYRPHPGE